MILTSRIGGSTCSVFAAAKFSTVVTAVLGILEVIYWKFVPWKLSCVDYFWITCFSDGKNKHITKPGNGLKINLTNYRIAIGCIDTRKQNILQILHFLHVVWTFFYVDKSNDEQKPKYEVTKCSCLTGKLYSKQEQ